MSVWNTLANEEQLQKTAAALEKNGISVRILTTADEAKEAALELIPEGSEVMTMTSKTLDLIGLSEAINESGNYISVKSMLFTDESLSAREKKKLGAAAQYSIGSVHAVTEDGAVLIASATGSQLPGYLYGSDHVIWVVGTQKIVANIAEGIKRVEEYVLPLESERARKAYGVGGSSINKLAIVHAEAPGRITILFVKESLGF